MPTLYAFDDGTFEQLPMAARRALDAAGAKLSLEGWKSLQILQRRELAELGVGEQVDVDRIRLLTALAQPSASTIAPLPEPPGEAIPAAVVEAFGPTRPISGWSALRALDRYTLAKIAAKARPERLDEAWREIFGGA